MASPSASQANAEPHTPHGNVSQRRAVTRDRLVAAAVSVFARKGVQGASVEEICEAAGFTRGAFYSNFADKNELCLAMLAAAADVNLAAANKALESLPPLSERVHDTLSEVAHRAVDIFLASVEGDPETIISTMELRLYAVREPGIRAAFEEFNARINGVFTDLVGEALRRYGLRLRQEPEQVNYLLHAVYDQMHIDQLIQGRHAPEEISAMMADLLMALVITDQQEGDAATS